MKKGKKLYIVIFCSLIIIVFSSCSFETDEFTLTCDDNNENCHFHQSTIPTNLGSDITPQEELIVACNWILNQEDVNIRLHTCTDERTRYPNPDAELPGGSMELAAGNARALSTIPLSEYQKGVFFGEENVEAAPESRYAFMTIYRTVFVHNTVHYAINAGRDPLAGEEIMYSAGSCTQNYRNSQRKSKYESGKYAAEIDDTVNVTKYLVLANSDGTTTDARYHSYTGIEQQIEQAGRDGKSFVEILESVIKSGNDDAHYYKDARVYDCRNINKSSSASQYSNDDASLPITDYGKGKWVYHKRGEETLKKYYSKPLAFAEYVPEKAISSGDSLPLIIWLHGLYETENEGKSESGFLSSGLLGVVSNWELNNIPAIIMAPRSYDSGWKSERNTNTVEAIIKYAIEKYNIDQNRIVLMGHSMGGDGVYYVGYKLKNYFSALVPMSPHISSYDGMDYFSSIPMKGFVEDDTGHKPGTTTFFKNTNHSSDLTVYSVSHGSIPKKALTADENGDNYSDLIYWALSQKKK